MSREEEFRKRAEAARHKAVRIRDWLLRWQFSDIAEQWPRQSADRRGGRPALGVTGRKSS